MTASQTRIAETIDAFYGEAGTRDNVSAYYRQAVEDLDAETVKELVLKPLPKLSLIYLGRSLSNVCHRSYIPILRIFPRRQRSHQKTIP
jgi:hypothetical protein